MGYLENIPSAKEKGNGLLWTFLYILGSVIFLVSGYFALKIPSMTWQIILTILSFLFAGYCFYKIGLFLTECVLLGLSFLILVINKLFAVINPLLFQFSVILLGVIGFIMYYTYIINNRKKLGDTWTVVISGLILIAMIVGVLIFGKA